ncbi:Hydroxyneurosporene synthase (CrtC) [Rhodobacteraceae bacterium THAF1]|uniref:lipocalin-like domain-containing protein n=1 Tax=Palleronia sp. THAF1 TaxID=2587842 RepID=UPI000F3C5FF6|nr:lipocalin-like domain-containing protein [Palleronia sp. THAF1]QFU08121.1 Hydroxyneurosporene synthase (CrtC) [Palleronia sp. THAF1]VDC27988.1 Hydroxyneurosporene synthase (CrtC) [Rhodobacteraceae bacterium THAF1]
MNARITRRALLLSAAPALAQAQGFAGLGDSSGDFAEPRPNPTFRFPQDHGPHSDYRIEWWYVTANLTGPDGTPYGIQWTLFRSALSLAPGTNWSTPQAWLGHAAITTPDSHVAFERLARGGIGQAGVEANPFDAWIDDWSMNGPSLSDVRLTAASDAVAYDLQLSTNRPFVPQGDGGYSVKSAEGQASYYYSQPFYDVTGTLMLPDGDVQVTGRAWLDREWSSSPLAETQSGWDWFSLHLGADKLMGFRLRDSAGPAYTSATWIAPDGAPTPYPDGAFSAEPLETARVADRDVPVRWRVRLPDKGVDVTVAAINDQCWMDLLFPYWEGPVTVNGSHDGIGYLEMTGYE